MNIKRSILVALLLWVLIFFEVSILMFGFKLEAGTTYYTIHYILLAIFTVIVGMIYFKKKASAKEGFFLGLILVIVSSILDVIITVPLFVKDYSFFLDKFLLIGLFEVIAITTIYGAVKK